MDRQYGLDRLLEPAESDSLYSVDCHVLPHLQFSFNMMTMAKAGNLIVAVAGNAIYLYATRTRMCHAVLPVHTNLKILTLDLAENDSLLLCLGERISCDEKMKESDHNDMAIDENFCVEIEENNHETSQNTYVLLVWDLISYPIKTIRCISMTDLYSRAMDFLFNKHTSNPSDAAVIMKDTTFGDIYENFFEKIKENNLFENIDKFAKKDFLKLKSSPISVQFLCSEKQVELFNDGSRNMTISALSLIVGTKNLPPLVISFSITDTGGCVSAKAVSHGQYHVHCCANSLEFDKKPENNSEIRKKLDIFLQQEYTFDQFQLDFPHTGFVLGSKELGQALESSENPSILSFRSGRYSFALLKNLSCDNTNRKITNNTTSSYLRPQLFYTFLAQNNPKIELFDKIAITTPNSKFILISLTEDTPSFSIELPGNNPTQIIERVDGKMLLVKMNDRVNVLKRNNPTLGSTNFPKKHSDELTLMLSLHDPVQKMKCDTCCFALDPSLSQVAVTSDSRLYLFDLHSEKKKNHSGPLNTKIEFNKLRGLQNLYWLHGEKVLVGLASNHSGIFFLEPKPPELWARLVPDFKQMERNHEYIEEEDEFDLLDKQDFDLDSSVDGKKLVKRLQTNVSRGDSVKLPMADEEVVGSWFFSQTVPFHNRYPIFSVDNIFETNSEKICEESCLKKKKVSIALQQNNMCKATSTKEEGVAPIENVDDLLETPSRSIWAATPALLSRYRYMIEFSQTHSCFSN